LPFGVGGGHRQVDLDESGFGPGLDGPALPVRQVVGLDLLVVDPDVLEPGVQGLLLEALRRRSSWR